MSAYAAAVTCYDIATLQLGSHSSEKMSAMLRTWPACCGWAGCRRRGVAPPEIRELRELTRYRHKVVGLRTSCRDQVHAVLAKLGVPVTHSDIFGVHGQAWLDGLRLPQPVRVSLPPDDLG